MENVRCPKCQDKDGKCIEVTHEWAQQRGVTIQADGEPNYDDTDPVENLGETAKVVCYECQECEVQFDLIDGKLVEQKSDIKKYFEGSLRERNGEQEYSYTYLIEAKDQEEAEMKFKELCAGWYDDDEAEWIEDGRVIEFGCGTLIIENMGVNPVDRDEWVKNLIDLYTLK